jgi:hypothetical protein
VKPFHLSSETVPPLKPFYLFKFNLYRYIKEARRMRRGARGKRPGPVEKQIEQARAAAAILNGFFNIFK